VYLPITSVAFALLIVAIAMVMLLRRRCLPAYVVAVGAALHFLGFVAQLALSPIAIRDVDVDISLGPIWQLGIALVSVGPVVFLSGLLWYLVGSSTSSASERTQA
jgi:hypothetical protein